LTMQKKILLVAVLILILILASGCTRPWQIDDSQRRPDTPAPDMPGNELPPPDEEKTGEIEFTFVPGIDYSVLLKEVYDTESDLLLRIFLRFDGFNHSVVEETIAVELPQKFAGVKEAREWLRTERPEELEVVPRTFVSDSVLDKWRVQGYNFEVESRNMISLGYLKIIGALTKINQPFVIYHEPEILQGLIKAVEIEFLPSQPNLTVTRNVKTEEDLFMYYINLAATADDSGSEVLAGANLELYYVLDSRGEADEFSFKISFHDLYYLESSEHDVLKGEMAAFVAALRDELVVYFDLVVVPQLEYENCIIIYDIAEGGGGYAEVFQLAVDSAG
jgi:hypothetical protein